MEFSKVMIIGAGQMGAGVAQVMAQSGITVVLRDIKQCFLDKGITTIDKNLSRSVAKGKLTDDEKRTILGRISCVVDLDQTNCDVDLVIEAATENIAIKKDIFKTLDELCPEKTILASNTSSVSITMLAATTKRPDKFVGMHFFNPAPVMKLVEVTKGLGTSEATFSAIKALAEKVGKSPVSVNDAPGFVGNRIMIPMINEAIFTLMLYTLKIRQQVLLLIAMASYCAKQLKILVMIQIFAVTHVLALLMQQGKELLKSWILLPVSM